MNDNRHCSDIVRDTCMQSPSDIVGMVLSTKRLPGKDCNLVEGLWFLVRQSGVSYTCYRLLEHVAYLFRSAVLRMFKSKWSLSKLFNVGVFCRQYGVPILHTDDLNGLGSVRFIKDLKPDLIISRINLLVGKDILDIPTLGAINSHPSVLPRYRGLDAVYWTMVNNETEFANSIHLLDEKFDSGDVIVQERVTAENPISMFSIETKVRNRGAKLLALATKQFRTGTSRVLPKLQVSPSYYSWPTRESIKRFRSNGHRFVSLGDVIAMFFKL